MDKLDENELELEKNETLKSNEEKLLKDLRHHPNDHFPTLVPHPLFKDQYQPTFFYLDGHADLLLAGRVLFYLSMRAINPEFGSDDVLDRNEAEFIHKARTVSNRFMPFGERAFMDHLSPFYREGKKAKDDE